VSASFQIFSKGKTSKENMCKVVSLGSSRRDWSIPALTRFKENQMWFSVDDLTWQTDSVSGLHLATSAVCINSQLVKYLHGIRQTVAYLTHFRQIKSLTGKACEYLCNLLKPVILRCRP